MHKTELRDVVVFLPGIGGTVLQAEDGKPLWSPSVTLGLRFLTCPGATLAALQLAEDDPEREVLEDGVLAVGLVPDVHLIPGLWKIDGYSSFTRMMTEAFELEMGSTFKDDGRTANYFEFAYDWRRDNRATARRLRRFVDDRLHRWRTNTPFKDAKSILVAHSMGGLVARYYPPGHSTLMLISIMPYAAARSWFPANAGEDWSKWRHSDEYEARKHELGERMIEAAETVVPNLRQHIVYRADASPVTYARYDWTSYGAIYGISKLGRINGSKSPIRNLVIAGSGNAGAGVEAVLISGAEAAEALLPGLLSRTPASLTRLRQPEEIGRHRSEEAVS